MSATHVIDASALAKLVLDEPHAEALRAWFTGELRAGARLIAPSLLPYELASALWRRVPAHARRGPHWTRDLVRDLVSLVELDPDAWARVDPWRDVLTAYDAAYLALAAARDASLVTYDRRLQTAAGALVPVIAPGA